MKEKNRRSDGQATWLAIRSTAVELIATYGFKGFNLRELAKRCGIKAGSLYNHIESKEGLLLMLLQDVMNELLAEFDKQVSAADGPVAQICAAIKVHIHFHTHRRMEVIIGNTELRSLSQENYLLVTGLRDRYENKLRQIIATGVEQDVFHVLDVKAASFAIIAMLTGVGSWYHPGGSLDYEHLVDIHEQLVLNMLDTQSNNQSN
ncbi:MAG: TetR/AcrR family transcriptional regulator [Pigmentiphaga sp.]